MSGQLQQADVRLVGNYAKHLPEVISASILFFYTLRPIFHISISI